MRHLLRDLRRAGGLAVLGAVVLGPTKAPAQVASGEVMIGQAVIAKIVGTGCNASVGDNFTLTFQPPATGTPDVIRFSFLSGTTGATLVQTQTGSSILEETFAKISGSGPGSNSVSFSGYSFQRSSKFKDSGEFQITLTFGPTCTETWRAAVTDWAGVSQ